MRRRIAGVQVPVRKDMVLARRKRNSLRAARGLDAVKRLQVVVPKAGGREERIYRFLLIDRAIC